ncbi:cytochrome C oxidase subunit IV family protein [Bradyrhizobium sp. CCBAU 45384]|uniref:cytochrome C oxidase subunit IV family protein n=1 Tax=Bradyrhizobium sp. CCBAU 45384 TaxID=858428 RepID=UPI0023059BC5|nr:cytochrome C oxidase subunit IV family protein [Bradyrhizobium sp. CCBAU 45384]
MSAGRGHQQGRSSGLWLRNASVWAALLGLLLLSMLLAYIPMGPVTVASGVAIAVVKSTLVLVFFMELVRSRALIRLAALAGLIFVAVMFALTLADVLTRAGKI